MVAFFKCQKVDYDGFEFYKPWLKFQTQSIIFEKEEVNIETYTITITDQKYHIVLFWTKNTLADMFQ